MQVRFSDPQSACRSRQSLLDSKVEANYVKRVRGVSKGVDVAPVKIAKMFPNSMSQSMKTPFDDANIELTFNLLKIRPE